MLRSFLVIWANLFALPEEILNRNSPDEITGSYIGLTSESLVKKIAHGLKGENYPGVWSEIIGYKSGPVWTFGLYFRIAIF